MPGGSVEVRFARWGANGRPAYEAKGTSATVPVQTTSFEKAAARAVQLVRYGALTPKPGVLKGASPASGSTSVQAPSTKVLTIDLQDPSMRDGVVPQPWLTGKPGSYLTAVEVILAAKERNVPVQIVDLSGGRGDKNLHAYVSVRNDAKGGAMYALITAGSNPPFKLPTAAGAAFRAAHADMNGQIGRHETIAAVNEFGAAVVGLPRGNRSARASGTLRTAAVTLPASTASTASTARTKTVTASVPSMFPRVKYRGPTTDLGYVMDNVGRMLPGLHTNPMDGILNCLNTAVALERQLAGKPALALPGHVPYEHDVYEFYGRLPIASAPQRTGPSEPFNMKSMLKYVESLPRGARGLLLVSSLEGEYGHAMVIQNVNGRAVILDAQNGYVVNPKALSTGVALGGRMPLGTDLSSMPDKPLVRFQFLRTDDVRNPGSALPKNVKQARVEVVDEYNKRVALQVLDGQGNITKQWVDQRATPGILKGLMAGENVYLVDDRSTSLRAPGMLVVKQSDGLKMLKRIESRQ